MFNATFNIAIGMESIPKKRNATAPRRRLTKWLEAK